MSRRGPGEGSLIQRADGRWQGAVTVGWEGGKRRRHYVYGRTHKEALEKLQKLQKQTAAQLPVTPARLTVGRYLDQWLARLPGTVSESTEDTYRRSVRLYINPTIGRIRLGSLTPVHVADMLRSMEVRGLAPETQRMARATLRRALRRAEQEGTLSRNVAAIAEGPRIPRIEGRTLTPDEARALLAAIRGDRLEAAYLLALTLGLRRGEVLGLAWSDVELDKPATLTVRQQLLRGRSGLTLSEVKTPGSRRSLYIPAPVVEVLRTHRAAQAAVRLAVGEGWADSEGLVFTTPLGTPVDPDNFRHYFSKLTQKAGLGHWHPHELRHSCASLLLATGVPLEVVSETLGHSSIRVTKDVYGHLLAPAKAAVAEAMSKVLWD